MAARMKPLPLLLSLVALTMALAACLMGAEPVQYIPLSGITVKDGDTITANVNFPWGVTLRDQPIRCLGYDAWESSRRRQSVRITDAELANGEQASAALSGLLSSSRVYGTPGKRERDNYGRLLVRLTVVDKDGKQIDVAEWMERNGHVRQPNSVTDREYD